MISAFLKQAGLNVGKKVYFDNGMRSSEIESSYGNEDKYLVSPYNLSSNNVDVTSSLRGGMLARLGIHEAVDPIKPTELEDIEDA